jgi:hypothetical protein
MTECEVRERTGGKKDETPDIRVLAAEPGSIQEPFLSPKSAVSQRR